MKKKKQNIDWSAVEKAMRRSVNGQATVADADVCVRAFDAEPKAYGVLSRKVKLEEVEATKKRYRGEL